MIPLSEIYNFVPVSKKLATAGQPSEEQLQSIALENYEAVINLGLMDPRYCLDDEAGLVRGLGMSYIHIPVNFQAPSVADLERFFDAMQNLAGKKVFVHCAANYRVSTFVSLYGQARLGWSQARADGFIRNVWEPDSVWKAFIQEARRRLLPQPE